MEEISVSEGFVSSLKYDYMIIIAQLKVVVVVVTNAQAL
jgi:hypothetical protein